MYFMVIGLLFSSVTFKSELFSTFGNTSHNSVIQPVWWCGKSNQNITPTLRSNRKLPQKLDHNSAIFKTVVSTIKHPQNALCSSLLFLLCLPTN